MTVDELKEFEDYLSEFDCVPKFDSETCRICGVNLSDSLSVNQVPLVELKFEDETTANKATKILDLTGIKSKKSSPFLSRNCFTFSFVFEVRIPI